jgi:hypothetical protein
MGWSMVVIIYLFLVFYRRRRFGVAILPAPSSSIQKLRDNTNMPTSDITHAISHTTIRWQWPR